MICLALAFFSFTFGLQAQLTGTKTIPTDYASIAAFVTDLNTQGVGAGGVVLDVPAGYTETLTARIGITATGTAANPITIQKSGSGANPILTSYLGTNTPSSSERDGMVSLTGSDYVTIDGIDLQEAATNLTEADCMEYGYGLFKVDGTNGSQFNTIKNCSITLNRLSNSTWTGNGHQGSTGIASLNCTPTVNTAITVTTVDGSNSFNKFYGNTIKQCNAGIVFIGFGAASPFDLGDQGNDVGGTAAATGNSIINFGGSVGATNPSTGIFANNQWGGFNCSYNTINNNDGGGANHPSTLRGIFLNSSATSASATVTNNNLTIHGGGTTSQVSCIENSFGSTAAGNTINISNNTITGSYISATTGAYYGIYSTSTPTNLIISNNQISNIVYSNLGNTGTGALYPIYNTGTTNALVQNNNISNISRFGTTGGTIIGINLSSGTGSIQTVKNNSVVNLSIDGTGASSTISGIQTSTGTIVVDSNLVSGLRCLKATGTGTLYGIYNVSSPTNENYNFNNVNTIINNGTGIVRGMYFNTATGVRTVSNNVVNTLSTNGITVEGITNTSSSPTVFNNKVYDITSFLIGASQVSGISVTSLGTSGVANLYNNYVGKLYAPNAITGSNTAPSIRGLNITSTTTTSSISLSHNTVYLDASSTGNPFTTAALFQSNSTTATSSSLTLKNNVFVNNSTASGSGYIAAFIRSAATFANYNSASNNNAFYAGVPGPNNVISFDGTTPQSTLANFQANYAPAESASITENPNFLSTTGSSSNFLHINTATPTYLESTGLAIAGITNDFDANIRQGNVGYAGTGTAPDLGADEFEGISVTPCSGTPTAGTISGTSTLCAGGSSTLGLVGNTIASGITYQWKESNVPGGPYTNVGTLSGYNTGVITDTMYYVAELTCTASGFSASTPEFTVIYNVNPSLVVTSTGSYCQGDSTTISVAGADTYVWTPATGLSATTGSSVVAMPASNTTYTIVGTNTATGCFSSATQSIAVLNTPSITAVTADPTSVCSGGSSQLGATYVLGGVPYSLTSTTGATYTPLSGAGITTINTTAQLTAGFATGNQDDGGVLVTLPFAFNYFGNSFSEMTFCTNGWVSGGNTTATTAAQSRVPGNLFTNTLPNNTIAAWFKDMGANFPLGTGSMRHGLIGTDVYAFQWDNAIGQGFTDGSTILISFQINIHGPASATPGRIEKIYGPSVGAITTGASIGIENAVSGTGNYLNALNGLTNSTTTSTAWPGNGNGYVYDPLIPSFAWTPSANLSNATIVNPLASNITSTGYYTLNLTSPNGCSDVDSVQITAGAALTSSSAITPGNTVCEGTDVTFTATAIGGGGPFTYAWSGPNAFTSALQTAVLMGATPAASGTYSCLITDNCGATSTTTVTLTVTPAPNVAVTPTSSLFCAGGSAVSLVASGADTYTWTPAAGLSATTGSSVNASPTATTTYIVTGTETATTCTKTASTVITFGAQVTIDNVTADPATVCAGDSTELTAIGSSIQSYCQPSYSSGTGFGDYVSSVQLNTLNSVSVGAPSPYYTLFPAAGTTTTSLTAGSTYTITLAAGTYTQNDLAAWIDYNQNGILDDAGEKLGETFNLGVSPASTSFTFTVPASAINGKTRLRVRDQDTGLTSGLSPCLSQSSFGETEDYIITILGGDDLLTYAWTPSADLTGDLTSSSVTANNITAATTYNVTATSSVGCSASGSVSVSVNAPTTSTITETACGSYTSPSGDVFTLSGTYTSTIPNSIGCDSIITINLTVNPLVTANIVAEACESYTSPSGEVYTTSGTYNDTIPSSSGCPIAIIIDLTINESSASTTEEVACGSYTWTNGTTYTVSGVYTQTLTNAAGCDSIATLDLTINQPSESTTTVSVCAPYVWTNNVEYTSSGTYTQTLTNAVGCDSIATLVLTVGAPTSSTTTISSCTPYTWTDGNEYGFSGTYTQTLTNAAGCDSVATLELTINSGSVSIEIIEACGSYTWAENGETYTESGMYSEIYTNAAGCDSIISIDLTIEDFNVVAINNGNATLTASEGATFVWIDCATNTAIPGATAQFYSATQNGSYAVVATSASGCVDTSDCVVIGNVGIEDLANNAIVVVYPNPTAGDVTVTFSSNTATVVVTDAHGKLVRTEQIQSGGTIALGNEQRGVYFLQVTTEIGSTMHRIVKN